MKTFFGIVISVFIALGIYLIINPIFIDKEIIKNLEDHRNYYTILSSIFSFLLTIIGMFLGFFYYFDNHKKSKTDKILSFILNELENYDESVEKIFFLNFSNQEELNRIRSKINRLYENIQMYTEENIKLLKIKHDELQSILAVHSYVEQNDILMLSEYDKIKDVDLLGCKDLYIEKILKAKRICINKLNE